MDSRNESLAATSSTPATETSAPEYPFAKKMTNVDPKSGAIQKAATLTLEEQVGIGLESFDYHELTK